jgi:enoyl-CoA hydratase/carnithine racemase
VIQQFVEPEMTDLIISEEENILWATINRASKANAISREVTDIYADALDRLARTPTLKGLIWTSCRDDLFSAGVDLNKPKGFNDQEASEWRTRIITDLVLATLRCPRPVVTAVRGRMIGGAFLNAISCDRIMAAQTATFQLPEVKIGIGSPIAATIVQHAANISLAQDLLLSAREISAHELKQSGGPCSPVDHDPNAAAAEAIENYAAMPAEAFGYMKKWFQAPRLTALQDAMRFTAETRAGKNEEVSAKVESFFSKR